MAKEVREIEVKAIGVDSVIKEFERISKTITKGTIVPRESAKSYDVLVKSIESVALASKNAFTKSGKFTKGFKAEVKKLQKQLKESGESGALGLKEMATLPLDKSNFKKFQSLLDESAKKVEKVSKLEGLLGNVNDRM